MVDQRKTPVKRSPRRGGKASEARTKYAGHDRLWRMVEGAVTDAFLSHPEYLTPTGTTNAVESITKRVVGNIVGHAKETRKGGRFGGS